MAYPGMKNTASGTEPSSGAKAERSIKVGFYSQGLNGHYHIVNKKHLIIGLGGGFNYDYFKVKTNYDNQTTREHTSKLTSGIHMFGFTAGMPVDLRAGRLCLELKPFIQFPFKKAEVSYLENELQSVSDPLPAYDNPLNYGFSVSLKITGK
jgi:hypothetical protein